MPFVTQERLLLFLLSPSNCVTVEQLIVLLLKVINKFINVHSLL